MPLNEQPMVLIDSGGVDQMEPSRQQERRPQPEVLGGFPERPELPECVTLSSYGPGCLHFWGYKKNAACMFNSQIPRRRYNCVVDNPSQARSC
jgi:hypothetical protein